MAARLALAALPVLGVLLVAAVARTGDDARITAAQATLWRALASGDYAAAIAAYKSTGDKEDRRAATLLAATLARVGAMDREATRAEQVDPEAAAARLRDAVRTLPHHRAVVIHAEDLRQARLREHDAAYRAALAAEDWLGADRALAELVALDPGDPTPAAALRTLRADHSPLVLARGRALWLVDPSTMEGTQLTDEAPVTRPVWSPDRSRIAFVASDPYDGRAPGVLYTIAADGSDLRPAARSIHPNALPSWSPDGNVIAATSVLRWDLRREAGVLAVNVVDLAGGTSRSLSVETGRHATSPAWSPTGEWVAFLARPRLDNAQGNPLAGPADVLLWSSVDGTFRNLTAGSLPDASRLVWAPDGQTLLVTTLGRGLPGETIGAAAAIVAIDIGSGEQRVVASGIDAGTALWSPAISPDGSIVAWTDGPRRVMLRDAEGQTRTIDTQRFLSGALTWSPSGDALLALAADPGSPSARIDLPAVVPVSDLDLDYDTQWPTGIAQWSPVVSAPAGGSGSINGVGLDR